MKVLIVINDLRSGGAQKSLVSFLKKLDEIGVSQKYEIDLMVSEYDGIFVKDIPQSINAFQSDYIFKWMNCPFNRINFVNNFSLIGLYAKIKTIIQRKILKKKINVWKLWKKYIPENEKEYDVAISYMDGWPNYYVIDKVKASKKVLWIHNEYQKLNYSKDFDKAFYEKCNQIITISDRCRDSFVEVFPEYSKKIDILENITLSSDIMRKANLETAEEFEKDDNKLKLLSVGRLSEQKAFDLAIKSANILKNNGINFHWIILGEGPDRGMLESLIQEYNLDEYVSLPGVKSNPYPYIMKCDIFVQTSIFEGKSIVLDEAKLLAKPIVVTNYNTVYDNIDNGKNGIITEMTPQAIASGIEKYISNSELKNSVVDELKNNYHGNEDEIQRYISLML